MHKFEYQIKQHPVGPNGRPWINEHSWIAEELASTCEVIAIPAGGMNNRAGKYSEIQNHLLERHGIHAPLVFVPDLDTLAINEDGTSVWVFHRQEAEITVHDIPRVIFSMRIEAGTK